MKRDKAEATVCAHTEGGIPKTPYRTRAVRERATCRARGRRQDKDGGPLLGLRIRLCPLREYQGHQRPLVDLRPRPPPYADEVLVVLVEIPALDVSVDGVVYPPARELPLEE